MAIPDPPASPPGWEVAPPDFVGVGAQRSGTTWWWWVLISHPLVGFKRGLHTKEVHFFDALQDVPELEAEDIDRYHRWFPRLPGTVIAVSVAPGEAVTQGQTVAIVEAMKMEHTLTAPFDGTVSVVHAIAGSSVTLDQVVVEVHRDE